MDIKDMQADIVEAAKVAVEGMPARQPWVHEVVDVVAHAILAERQRCAEFAETYKLADHNRLSPGSEINAWWSGQEFAYEAVRRGILGLPLPPSIRKDGA